MAINCFGLICSAFFLVWIGVVSSSGTSPQWQENEPIRYPFSFFTESLQNGTSVIGNVTEQSLRDGRELDAHPPTADESQSLSPRPKSLGSKSASRKITHTTYWNFLLCIHNSRYMESHQDMEWTDRRVVLHDNKTSLVTGKSCRLGCCQKSPTTIWNTPHPHFVPHFDTCYTICWAFLTQLIIIDWFLNICNWYT